MRRGGKRRTPPTSDCCMHPIGADFGPIKFADKPDIPFSVLGYTDLDPKVGGWVQFKTLGGLWIAVSLKPEFLDHYLPQDFVYFKTPGGHWVAAAEDKEKRLFMIDEIGDLYYDSGDPDVGLYAVSAGCTGGLYYGSGDSCMYALRGVRGTATGLYPPTLLRLPSV